MMISSKGGPDGQPAMWESTIKGNLMNTRTTMRTLAWSGWRLAMLVGAIMLVTALPREVAAQSANANLRGKAPPNSRGHGQECRHGLHATHPGGGRRFLRAGGPPAGHLPGRCRSRDRAERHAGRRLDGDPGFRRRGASDGAARRDRGPGHAAERGQDVGGRRQHFACARSKSRRRSRATSSSSPTRCRACSSRSMPRATRRSAAGRSTPGRPTSTSTASGRRTTCGRAASRGKPAPIRTQGAARTRIPSAIRATRSLSSPSPNTRSSRRTTRPSTTRFRAPRSRR